MAEKCDIDERLYSRYFKAFGDPTRLKIISYLSAREMTVNEIVAAVGLTQPTVSRHLALLRQAEIVIDRRQGQQVFYSLNKNIVRTCCSEFCDCLQISAVVPRKSKKK